jgi:HEAT repeat protein
VKLEDKLDALSRLRENPGTPAARLELGKYLDARSNLLVAKAAKIVAEFELRDFQPRLVEAFHRFMKEPATSDRGCAAKTEAVRALCALAAEEDEVYLIGIHHIQMEPSFGRPVDTAPGLRAASALGLVRMNHPDALAELLVLMVDREADARIGAVRALAYSGKLEAEPVLRFKVLVGDASPEVTGECFTALISLAPARSVGFVGRYVESDDATVAEAAIMALGQSRQDASVDLLIRTFQPVLDESRRRSLLMALAMARQENAMEFLFSLARDASEKIAAEAIAALAMYRHNQSIRGRVETLLTARDQPGLFSVFRTEFGPAPGR